jgi:hypothetical protein
MEPLPPGARPRALAAAQAARATAGVALWAPGGYPGDHWAAGAVDEVLTLGDGPDGGGPDGSNVRIMAVRGPPVAGAAGAGPKPVPGGVPNGDGDGGWVGAPNGDAPPPNGEGAAPNGDGAAAPNGDGAAPNGDGDGAPKGAGAGGDDAPEVEGPAPKGEGAAPKAPVGGGAPKPGA